MTALARTKQWSQVRVVGKQFPPWTEGDDVWGVQNIMHPDLAKLGNPLGEQRKGTGNGSSDGDQGDQSRLNDNGDGSQDRKAVDLSVFREWYGSEQMLRVSAALMGCSREEMQFGKLSSPRLAISWRDCRFSQRWI